MRIKYANKTIYFYRSTDEDARQAFQLNNGKIKEVQIQLMLSSRTEMQKVIESARNQSLAAFMQAAPPAPPVAIPAAVPPIVPAAVPEIKKSSSKEKETKSDKRDKRRSRSRSRDRKETRSRDRDRRDRRHRDRSRSRSRDRRDRRRHDRSRSRDRTRSRDRDRKSKDYSRGPMMMSMKDPKPVVWEAPPKTEQVELPKAASLLGSFVPNLTLEEARRNLNALTVPAALALATAASATVTTANNDNGFHNQNIFERVRDSWPPNGRQNNPPQLNFTSPSSEDFQNNDDSNSCNSFTNQNQNAAEGNFNQQFNDNNNRGFNRNMPQRGPNNRFQGPARNAVELQTNCCVQIEPLFGAYSDIRRFFQGLFISNTGIKYVTDDYGKRTGIVYVRFAYAEGKEQALLRNGASFRNNPVKVTHIDDEVFDNYSPGERYNPEPFLSNTEENENLFNKNRNMSKIFNRNTNTNTQLPLPAVFSALLVEDIPTYAKEQDILKMFSEYSLNSILMKKVRQNHMAYVKFNNADDAKKALMEKVTHVVDGKPVTVKPCKDEEYEEFEAQQNKIEINTPEPEKKLIDTDCIVLNNLPLKTNDRDISDFFSDVGIIPTKIHLMSNHLGFTGTVYCEFSTCQESTTSLEKDGVQLGSNIISVKPIPRKEMQSMLGITIPGNQPPIHPPLMQQPIHRQHFMPRNNFGMRPNFMGPRPMRRFHPPVHQQTNDIPGCTVLMENVPYKAGLDEILEFFDGYNIRTDSVLRRFNDNGTPSGEAKVFFNNPDDAYQAVQEKRGCTIRDRTIYLTHC